LVYKEVFGIRLPRHDELETEVKKGAGSFSDFAAHGRRISLDEVRSGDVLHMWGSYQGKRRATHCGIVTEPGYVLHAEEVVGSCVSRYKGDSRFLHRVIGAYRLE
jgi:cell wall-associated NlpC family hydrolase